MIGRGQHEEFPAGDDLMPILKTFASAIFLFISILSTGFANAQTVDRYEKYIQKIGSSKIKNTTIEILIVFRIDSALLLASISDAGKPEKYIPLLATVDSRETIPMKLSIFSSESNDRIWINFQGTDNSKNKGVLAYYVLGSEKALTSLGQQKLLDTPTPGHLSVSPQTVRGFNGNRVRALATFYFSGREETSALPR